MRNAVRSIPLPTKVSKAHSGFIQLIIIDDKIEERSNEGECSDDVQHLRLQMETYVKLLLSTLQTCRSEDLALLHAKLERDRCTMLPRIAQNAGNRIKRNVERLLACTSPACVCRYRSGIRTDIRWLRLLSPFLPQLENGHHHHQQQQQHALDPYITTREEACSDIVRDLMGSEIERVSSALVKVVESWQGGFLLSPSLGWPILSQTFRDNTAWLFFLYGSIGQIAPHLLEGLRGVRQEEEETTRQLSPLVDIINRVFETLLQSTNCRQHQNQQQTLFFREGVDCFGCLCNSMYHCTPGLLQQFRTRRQADLDQLDTRLVSLLLVLPHQTPICEAYWDLLTILNTLQRPPASARVEEGWTWQQRVPRDGNGG